MLYEATRSGGSEWSSWLSAVGVILFVSGFTSTLFGSSVWGVGEEALVSGFVAGTVGLALGVTTMVLLVRPEFGGDSPVARLCETAARSVWGDDRTGTEPGSGASRETERESL
ncbi:hypothetical protein [Natronorarus salvus]|uniref:hypothetical protein n=1 Tax=Natronorarus salvus TaxID=3117733 RepID=UPI002F262B7E